VRGTRTPGSVRGRRVTGVPTLAPARRIRRERIRSGIVGSARLCGGRAPEGVTEAIPHGSDPRWDTRGPGSGDGDRPAVGLVPAP